jgi:hypothetical protein
MEYISCVLAEIPNFGKVYDCGECGNIHLSVGPVSLTLAPDAYLELTALINSSAAQFETWLINREKIRMLSRRGENGTQADSEDAA